MRTHLQMQAGNMPMDIIVDGTEISIKGKDGAWHKKEQSAKTKEILKNLLGENFSKQDLKDITKNYEIKRNRAKDGWFGRSRAVDFTPKGKLKPFAKKTSWIDPDTGLTMESVHYDANGNELVHHKVKNHQNISGVEIGTEYETDSQTAVGKAHSHTVIQNVSVNQNIDSEFR